MSRKLRPNLKTSVRVDSYAAILTELVGLLESARRTSARAVNAVMTATYWQIGRRIVEHEQAGADRAEYGALLLPRLSADLTKRFGRGFSEENLRLMRLFYLSDPRRISQTTSGKLRRPISQTASGK